MTRCVQLHGEELVDAAYNTLSSEAESGDEDEDKEEEEEDDEMEHGDSESMSDIWPQAMHGAMRGHS